MTRRLVIGGLLSAVLVSVVALHIVAEKQSKPISVGMIPLLSAPQQYDNKRIRTWGYLHLGRIPENDSLWLRKEDGDVALLKNSFGLVLTSEQRQAFSCVNHTYVLLEGTLLSQGLDTSSMNSGSITRITHVTGWSPYRDSPCQGKQ
jgi:hypothetical protein